LFYQEGEAAKSFGQQSFRGSPVSGTNDWADSKINLLKWTSVRTISETFVLPMDNKYPVMAEK
jgi:1-pyrroline-5-carboxylate dehydrogenase